MPGYGWITLTTDYGLVDGFGAVLHGVIAQQSPWVRVIDISHEVPPGDVVRGAAVLAQSIPYFPPAVHVAVVDPGVGTARRAVAVRTPAGILVGPDNGLLPGPAEALGGILGAVSLAEESWFRDPVSATFHGRDIFAPVAARLAAGAPFEDAGPLLDPASLVRLPEPMLALGDGYVDAEVISIDHFGNVALAAPGETLTRLSERVLAGGLHAVRATTFADAPPGGLVVYVDSADRLALAINGGRAVVALGVVPGDVLRLTNL